MSMKNTENRYSRGNQVIIKNTENRYSRGNHEHEEH